ncbi:MAG: hypothetical protein JXB39_16605 [Deltaproteobacteria bacterium]|nr:hypothetical protein [Deltaproteobacteria bacterium]
MADSSAFVIPAGVRFHAGQQGVSVEHAGDIMLEAPIGGRLERVRSRDGSVFIHGRATIEHIEAPNGTVRLEGPVQAGYVQGDIVELAGSPVRARAVRGHRQIVVGAIRIDVDVLMAPRIDIDPKASGRAPIIECHNEPGPNAIKGGFSAAEYGDLLGDARKFLADRGLEPLEPAPETDADRPAPPAVEDPAASPPPVPRPAMAGLVIGGTTSDDEAAPGESVEDPDTSPGRPPTTLLPPDGLDFVVLGDPTLEERPEGTGEVLVDAVAPVEEGGKGPTPEEQALWEAPDAPSVVIEDEEVSAPIEAFSMDDLSLPPGAEHPPPAAVRRAGPGLEISDPHVELSRDLPLDRESLDLGRMLQEKIRDLRRFYPTGEEPAPVTSLALLAEEGRIEDIAEQLPTLWNELLAHHRDHGIRIRRQVTNLFNDILSLLKGAPSIRT